MITLKTEILERSQDGDFHLTEKGEFLSYFDAHLRLFEEILITKKLSKEKEAEAMSGIKNYMEKNTTKTEHFFEQMDSFSSYLHVGKEELGEYLTSRFIGALEESQKKVRNQELDRLESGDAFKSILDEVLFKVGDIFPQNSIFTIKDELLVIHDKSKNTFLKPVGLLVEVKAEQEKLKDKLEAEKQEKEKPKIPEKKAPEPTPVKETPVPVAPAYVPETSILIEILQTPNIQFPKKKLEVKESAESDDEGIETKPDMDIPQPIVASIPEIEPVVEDDEPPPIAEIPVIEEEISESLETLPEENPPEEVSFMEGDLDLGGDEPQIQEEIPESMDFEVENPEESNPVDNSEIVEIPEQDLSEEPIEEEPEPPKPNLVRKPKETIRTQTGSIGTRPFQIFNYIHYLTIQRSIEKTKDNPVEYKNFLNSSSVVTKCFVSIQVNIAKEMQMGTMDWDLYFSNLEKQTGVEISVLSGFKVRIQKLNLTKKALELIVSELKKQPESVTKILKSGWPHIVDAFGDSPDFSEVSNKLEGILSRIKNPEIREPIETIIQKALRNLEKHCENLNL